MPEMTAEQLAAYRQRNPHLFNGPAPAPAHKDWTPYESDPDIEAALDAHDEAVYAAHKTKGKAAALALATRFKEAGAGKVNLPAGPVDTALEQLVATVARARAKASDEEIAQIISDYTRALSAAIGEPQPGGETQLTDQEKPMQAAKDTRSVADKTLASIRAAHEPSTFGALVRRLMGGK